jgi:hypothetical protein
MYGKMIMMTIIIIIVIIKLLVLSCSAHWRRVANKLVSVFPFHRNSATLLTNATYYKIRWSWTHKRKTFRFKPVDLTVPCNWSAVIFPTLQASAIHERLSIRRSVLQLQKHHL